MTKQNRREIERYCHYEGGSAGSAGATLVYYSDLTAELKCEQRAMGTGTEDCVVVFGVKPLHELHGLLRVDSIDLAHEAREIAGYCLAAQLWDLPEENYQSEDAFLKDLNWTRDHLFFAGATYEYLKMRGSIPRVPDDVGLIDMQPNTYWNETFDLIFFARFAPSDIRDVSCRNLLGWIDKMKFSAEREGSV